ncbi:M20 metallopeptidase family protein [Aminipila luticellarii]|uniref:Amidohydrolase n=1 Tax=Aminipila luticellarii TaxID=2507160 RepID=A0A410PST1_9FIRM|nr:M20 family metallopeptidase [Aminipila luticellarii]QAT41960.1 amidohydrolase [Aminipila luticellarii]
MKDTAITKKVKDIEGWVIEHRRDFHLHPELSLQEFRTTGIIKEELKKMGIEAVDLGETGVMGIIRGKGEGKVVALRGDMDALPVTEDTGFSFTSSNPGVMHACGHDAHTSMMLGAARILSEMREEFNGTVKLIFQAAEEMAVGAKAAIESGVMDNPKVDAIVGMHIFSDYPVGTVVVQEGPFMASCDSFELEILGNSCHGSAPWQGNDANMCAVAVIQALQTIVSRKNDVRVPLVLNVGTIEAGERFNVTSGKAVMTGTTRTFSEEVRRKVPAWMENIINGICAAYECTGKLDYHFLCPAVDNDKSVAEKVKLAAAAVLGEENVIRTEMVMGSEDFSEYQQFAPGMMVLLGTGNKEKDCVYPIHSNHFKIDEDALSNGVAVYVQSALELLK